MAQGINGPDFQHVAFCTNEASAVESRFRQAGFPTARYRSVELSYRRPGPFMWASLQLARELRQHKIALVHCSDLMAGLRAVAAAKLVRLPVVCHIRNPHPGVSGRDRYVLRGVNRFVFVSLHARNSFGYVHSPHLASVIYDGIETQRIGHIGARNRLAAELSIPSDVKWVGMVARLAAQKDHLTLVRAAARVVRIYPKVRFLIVGDHTSTDDCRRYFEEVSDLIRTYQLSSHVTFTGFREDIPEVLAALDISVLSTHFEGFGLVIVEAMAQERPVIATAVGGVTEIIQHQQNGLLHRHEDDEDLAAQLLALLSDDTLAARIGREGRRSVEDRFGMAAFTESMSAVYRSLLE